MNRSASERDPGTGASRVVRLHGGPATRSEPSHRSDVERVLSDLLDDPPGVELTSSCTHALEAAAQVLGIGPGDEVIVPAYSFPSTANPFLLRGAEIRFADCDPSTGNITPAEIERCTSERTRAVVCMHYGGVACDMKAIGSLRDDGEWALVEDAAHGLFARFEGKPLGRFGALGAFSFHQTKNISCHEGGALVVNDAGMLDAVSIMLDKGTNRVAFDQGTVTSYEWSGVGSSWRLADPLVALLAGELERRDHVQARRHAVWRAYADGLVGWADGIGVTPAVRSGRGRAPRPPLLAAAP